jgi:hypothetical protein
MDLLTILLIVFVVAVLCGGFYRYNAAGSLSLLEVLIIVVLLVVLLGGWGIHRHYYYPLRLPVGVSPYAVAAVLLR